MSDNIFEFGILEFRSFNQTIEVVDICFLVFAIVEFDSTLADCRFESVFFVRQLR